MINKVKIAILPKVIYRFNTAFIKILPQYYTFFFKHWVIHLEVLFVGNLSDSQLYWSDLSQWV